MGASTALAGRRGGLLQAAGWTVPQLTSCASAASRAGATLGGIVPGSGAPQLLLPLLQRRGACVGGNRFLLLCGQFSRTAVPLQLLPLHRYHGLVERTSPVCEPMLQLMLKERCCRSTWCLLLLLLFQALTLRTHVNQLPLVVGATVHTAAARCGVRKPNVATEVDSIPSVAHILR